MIGLVNGNALRIPLRSGSVALVVTSPPYWDARPEYSTWPTYAAYLADMALVWAECYRVLIDGGRIAVNVPQGFGRPSTGGYLCIGDDTTRALTSSGFTLRGHIIWNKKVFGGDGLARLGGTAWGSWLSASDPCLRDMHELIIVAHKGSPGRGPGRSTIDRETFVYATGSMWDIPPAVGSSRWHPAPFPAEIPRRLIELYSFAGDVVLDPFSGAGTTIKAALATGRQGIGLELDAGYARRSMRDLSALNGDYDLARSLSKVHHRPVGVRDLPMFAELLP